MRRIVFAIRYSTTPKSKTFPTKNQLVICVNLRNLRISPVIHPQMTQITQRMAQDWCYGSQDLGKPRPFAIASIVRILSQEYWTLDQVFKSCFDVQYKWNK